MKVNESAVMTAGEAGERLPGGLAQNLIEVETEEEPQG